MGMPVVHNRNAPVWEHDGPDKYVVVRRALLREYPLRFRPLMWLQQQIDRFAERQWGEDKPCTGPWHLMGTFDRLEDALAEKTHIPGGMVMTSPHNRVAPIHEVRYKTCYLPQANPNVTLEPLHTRMVTTTWLKTLQEEAAEISRLFSNSRNSGRSLSRLLHLRTRTKKVS